ncbi:MAG: DNA polymerase III subunit delta' [Candidatus Marinimicrobia bacterium]|nr:DNA polymerase III subunit delta' [Candidatus Neomarinimicrobiota bacterium]
MISPKLLINNKNWQRLVRSRNSGKLPHALLFHGSEGTGKEGHALELAALLNCSRITNEEPCGNCPSCIKTKSFQHGNVKLILPLPRGKIKSRDDSIEKAFSSSTLKEYWDLLKQKEDDPYFPIRLTGANTILINSIRELKHDLALSVVNNEWRIILIFQAEKLCIPSPEAAHSLLKVLEEPPEKTLFILVSSQPGTILDTIHSRCQSLYFPPISTQILQERLINSGTDPVQATVMARISYGNVRLSQELKENSTDLMEKLVLFLNACFSNDPSIWNKCIDTTARLKIKDIRQMEQLFRCAVLFFRDMLYYSATGSDDEIIYKNKMNKIDKLTKLYSDADWHSCIQHIENTQNYISRNGYLPVQIICMILDIQKSLRGEIYEPFQLSDWTPV